MLVKLLTDHGSKPTVVVWDAGSSGRKEVYAEYKADAHVAPDLLKRAVAALRAARRGVRLPQRHGRGLRGRRRHRLDRRARPRARASRSMIVTGDRDAFQLIDPDGSCRSWRRAAASPTRSSTTTQAVDRALRHHARADPRLLRPQGRHVGQHPGRPGHRRQDRVAAAAAVRRPRGRPRRASTTSPAPSASRTSPSTPTTRGSPRCWRRSSATSPSTSTSTPRPPRRPTARSCARSSASSSCATRCAASRRRSATTRRPRPRRRPSTTSRRRVREGTLADVARCRDAEVARRRRAPGRRGRAVRRDRAVALRRRDRRPGVLVGACDGPADVVARARRPAGRRPRRQVARRRCRRNLVHDTLLAAYLLEPARRGYPFRELVRGARAGSRRRGPGRRRRRAHRGARGVAARAARRPRPDAADGRDRAAARAASCATWSVAGVRLNVERLRGDHRRACARRSHARARDLGARGRRSS